MLLGIVPLPLVCTPTPQVNAPWQSVLGRNQQLRTQSRLAIQQVHRLRMPLLLEHWLLLINCRRVPTEQKLPPRVNVPWPLVPQLRPTSKTPQPWAPLLGRLVILPALTEPMRMRMA